MRGGPEASDDEVTARPLAKSGPPLRLTPQLRLRATTEDDIDALFAIQGDAAAMLHTFCSPDRESTRRFLLAHAARQAVDGFSPWTAERRDDRCVAGWGGLCRDPQEPEWGVEVIYFLGPAHWGHGLASEIVRAALEHAFEDLALAEVGAFAKPANAASQRVLEKAGFRKAGYTPGLERDRFLLTRAEWLSRRS